MSIFGTVLISITTLMHIYVFWRAASVPFVKQHVSIIFLVAVGVIFWALFFLGREVGHGGTGRAAFWLEMIGMNWMATLFLIFITLFTIDLVTLFGLLIPRVAPSLRGLAMVVGIIFSGIAMFQGMRPPVVRHYDVILPGLPSEMDGKILVGASDMHIGNLLGQRWLAARIEQIQALRPDLIVLLGDIVEGHGEPREELLPTLGRLSAPLGVWAVSGNHEFHGWGGNGMRLFEEAGFQVLRDRWAEVRPGFVIAGVDDLTRRRRSGRMGDPVSEALTGRPPGTTVLLSHTPWEAEQAADDGVRLMLSGHTHGGQVWPFSYLTRLIYPLLGGRYNVDGMTVIVCRGTGTWGPRMRLWRPGEILRVTLRRLPMKTP
jgi:predicted MPP superfamily phosphohydrolase